MFAHTASRIAAFAIVCFGIVSGVNAYCKAGRSALTCDAIVPWSSNASWFGDVRPLAGLYARIPQCTDRFVEQVCQVYDPHPDTALYGYNCGTATGPGRIRVCCRGNKSNYGTPCLGAGIDCLPEYVYSLQTDLPPGWQSDVPCVEDYAARVIQGDQTFMLDDNTPANCIKTCSQLGYTRAEVEYTNECHCGSGLKTPYTTLSTERCDYPCKGDERYSCGGSWAMQTFKWVG